MNAPIKKRVLGIDFGFSRIGLAISDLNQLIASPLKVLKALPQKEETINSFLEEIKELPIEEIIIGLPLQLDGVEGKSAQAVLDFKELLSQKTAIPIKTWDERLTSLQAEKIMKDGGLNRKKRAEKSDLIAASIILQSYLDTKRLKNRHELLAD